MKKKVKVCGTITLFVNKYIEIEEGENPYNIAEEKFSGIIQNTDGSICVSDTETEYLEINQSAQVDFFDYIDVE